MSSKISENSSGQPQIASPDMTSQTNSAWSVWYIARNEHRAWEMNLTEVATFEKLEDFWTAYYLIKSPSQVLPGSDFAIFRKGIRPSLDDKINKPGGRWIMSLTKHMRKYLLDDYWLLTVLLLVGQQFEYCEEVCGAVVSVNSEVDTVSVWTKSTIREVNIEIGKKLKQQMSIFGPIGFEYHNQTTSKYSPIPNYSYSI